MAVLYSAAAWFIMQVAEVVFGLVGLPEQFGRVLLILLAVGFPIALVFSWFYELTPEGLALDTNSAVSESIIPFGGRRTDFIIIAILSAAVLMFAYDKWWETGPENLSIAVLPFENMSSDPEQEYFSDGISDEILNLLGQIQPLKVTARTSSFWFKGKDFKIADIADELNVRHILEGGVRRSGDRVRITAQLIDARDSSHLWSQTFDRDYNAENLFYVQSEIARAITGQLRMTLTGEDKERLANVPTTNTEAYAAYLLGRQRLTDRKVDGLKDAIEQFTVAIELDAEFVGAYSGLSDACALYRQYSGGHTNENCPPSPAEIEQLVRKALELDPESGEAWISLGAAISDQLDDSLESMPKLREAIAAYERGLELNPSLSHGYHWYGMALGNYRYLYPDPPWGWLEAWKAGVWQSVYDKGLEVDPLSITLHYMKAIYPWVARSEEEAIFHGRRMVEIAPDSPRGYETLGEQAWNLSGRVDESIRWESKALELDPKHLSFATSIGRAYSALGDPDMALAYFDLAKTLTAPDNQPAQNDLLVQQAIIRLVSGSEGAHHDAELRALLSESKSFYSLNLGTFVDLVDGRPADALARIEAFLPQCLAAESIEKQVQSCPLGLVRIYEDLDEHTAAKDLADGNIRDVKIWADVFPGYDLQLGYAAALAVARRTDEALDKLEDVVSSGWRGDYRVFLRFTIYFRVEFDAIRDHERFKAIVATIEADMARQLENVREMQRRGEVPTLEEVQAMIASAEQESGSDGE
jgi:TolB-like protein/Flp pilus assembly protein TadD